MTRASDTAKLLGAGATILDGTTISTADNTSQLTLTSTDADALVGPSLDLYRNSASPADNDFCGQISFQAENDAGEKTTFGVIKTRIIDASNGTEDFRFSLEGMVAGSSSQLLKMDNTNTVFNEDSADIDFRVESNGNANMLFVDGGNNAVVIGQSAPETTISGFTPAFQVIGVASSITRRVASSSGPLLALAKSRNTSVDSFTVVQNGDSVGEIVFFADDGTNLDSRVATIKAEIDGAAGANDTPGRLVFMTTADGAASTTEAMRITKSQNLALGVTSELGRLHVASNGAATTPCFFSDTRTGSTSTTCVVIHRNGSNVGAINTTNNSTAYGTSSDYRLKENVSYDFDATARVKQLKPARFNFITDADNTVDGFLAHEVSSIVPEAIHGTKDATKNITNVVLKADGTMFTQNISEADWEEGKLSTTDEDGNTVDPIYASDTTWVASKTVPDYQQIDQSKLVPLLVKTIQELEARITALES